MSERLTYILGAGASADSIPTVQLMPQRMWEMCDEIEKIITSNFPKSESEILNDFMKTLAQIDRYAKNYASVDSFMQDIHKNGRIDGLSFDKAKAALAYFIAIEQMKNPIEKRYNQFFTKINHHMKYTETGIVSPINFISWNYDTQIEQYFFERGYPNASISKISKFTSVNENNNNMRIIHLNGIAGIYHNEYGILMDLYNRSSNDLRNMLLETCFFLREIHRRQIKIRDCMTFYWENNLDYDKRIEQAVDLIKISSHVVIIGYSFPDDNWEADEKLIKALDSRNLEVTIQKRTPNINNIRVFDQVNLNKEVRSVSNVDQFYIPGEFLKYRQIG